MNLPLLLEQFVYGILKKKLIADPENIASSSVLEGTGFIKEGHIKESIYFNGEFRDEAIYSRLK